MDCSLPGSSVHGVAQSRARLSDFTFSFYLYFSDSMNLGKSRDGLAGKESSCNAGDLGSIPELERSPGGGNGNLLQYACVKNSMDRGAWWAIVHGGAKSQT